MTGVSKKLIRYHRLKDDVYQLEKLIREYTALQDSGVSLMPEQKSVLENAIIELEKTKKQFNAMSQRTFERFKLRSAMGTHAEREKS